MRAKTDSRKRRVTLRHLLDHTSGYGWKENELILTAWIWSSDYVRFFLELPFVDEPDKKFIYNTAGTHALSALLGRTSGMTTLEFADRYLFAPTGMEVRRWDRSPEGNYIGGAEMHFTARHLARFALLYLNGGRWDGKEVLPEDWVKESTAEHVKADYETPSNIPVPESWTWSFLEDGNLTGYGYLWWRRDTRGHETFVALGYGGQFILIIPDLELGNPVQLLDGTALAERLPDAEKLSDGTGEDDYPSIAVGNGSIAWSVWQTYFQDQDEVRLAKYAEKWRTYTTLPGVSGDVWRPQVALGPEGKPTVVWSQQVAGNFDLYARTLDPETQTWSKLLRLSSHPNPDFDHRLISDDSGNQWLVWQGFHGDNSDIFLRYYRGSGWSEEVRVTEDPANDWEPRVAVDSKGKAYIVWDTYRNGNGPAIGWLFCFSDRGEPGASAGDEPTGSMLSPSTRKKNGVPSCPCPGAGAGTLPGLPALSIRTGACA